MNVHLTNLFRFRRYCSKIRNGDANHRIGFFFIQFIILFSRRRNRIKLCTGILLFHEAVTGKFYKIIFYSVRKNFSWENFPVTREKTTKSIFDKQKHNPN